MDIPPGNWPGCSFQNYQSSILQPSTNYEQVFPLLNTTLDHLQHTEQQCTLMHTVTQGQEPLPRSPIPLDLTLSTFHTAAATLPTRHQPYTAGRNSASQAVTLTPHIHQMSSSDDDETYTPPQNGWQNVSYSKRRKVHSPTAHSDVIQLHNKLQGMRILSTKTVCKGKWQQPTESLFY